MTRLSISLFTPLLFAGVLAIITSSCTLVDNKDQKALSYGTCEGCHTDYEHLKLVYTPDTAAPVGGCGGDAPHYEPYDRVYLGGAGYDAYKQSTHGTMECIKCHNGNDYESDKTKAHSGDFIKHPSSQYDEKCGKCHTEADNFSNNLHNGIGQKRKVTIRSGLTGHEQFDQLPQHKIEGYNANCATCHGTCGNCHVVRPPIAGGGLSNGHQFIAEPDMLTTCISCHTSRGGHAYLGRGTDLDPTIKPDIHLTYWGPGNGFECLDCHNSVEIHGTAETPDHRYEYSELPKCQDCHDPMDSEFSSSARIYHAMHTDDFNCQVCHSQDYNNCGECHIHGDGARLPSHLDFKIALNPLENPDADHDFPYALVRRTLAAPDNWDVYTPGDDYDNFDAFPMFNYTTPHNIQKITKRTVEGADWNNCMINCHIIDGVTNKEYFLLDEDLTEPWMQSSTGHLTVDDKLPAGWFNK